MKRLAPYFSLLLLALTGCQSAAIVTTTPTTPLAVVATPLTITLTPSATAPRPATTAPGPTAALARPAVTATPRPAPTPSVPFGLEQAHLLAPLLGSANAFGSARLPADPSAFNANNTVRSDPGAFRGSRQLVGEALEQGRVAFVLEIDVKDAPEVVAAKARALATMSPRARPALIIIGNELNLRRMADYPVETYYAQLRAAYDAVKAVAPDVQISTDGQNYWEGAPFEHPMADPNASNRLRALLKLFERDQWTPDVITLHVFDSAFSPGDPREVYSLVGRTRFVKDILSGYNLPRQPALFVGEFGLPVAEPIPAAQQGKYWRFFITEREQADLAFLAGAWSAATGTALNYFGGVDTPREGLRRNERDEIVEGVYGLVDRDDNRPRPAFAAYQRAQALLRGARGQIVSDGRDGTGSICFTPAHGGLVCVAQATTGRPTLFVSDPLPPDTRFRVEDVLGQALPNAGVQDRTGRITVNLPGAPAQKTGGPVRVLIVEP